MQKNQGVQKKSEVWNLASLIVPLIPSLDKRLPRSRITNHEPVIYYFKYFVYISISIL